MTPREVPLGGPRAMTVRRTLPQRERSLIGAWCFLDHYGPDDVADTGGMSVAPHPHTGLQTVSWLFTGEIEHRDSAGHHAMVRPGRAEPDDRRPRHQPLRGLDARRPRCCTAPSSGSRCPSSARDGAPAFDHYAPAAVTGDGWEARVFLGSLLGDTSPVATAHARCSAPSCCSPPAPSCTSTSTRRSSTASWSTPASSRSATSRPSSTSSPTCRPAPSGSTIEAVTRRPGAAARRPAVRRGDRDVVELRRPQPRGGRRLPRGVDGPARRTATPTAGSASRPATTCRRSRRRRCPTPGSRNVAEPCRSA